MAPPRPPVIQGRGRERARGLAPKVGRWGGALRSLTRRPSPPSPARVPVPASAPTIARPSHPVGEVPLGLAEPCNYMYLILNLPRNPMGRAFFRFTEVEAACQFPKVT